MRPLFTVHAGEFLVGSHIERNFKYCQVWVPTTDRGIDLLVTNSTCGKNVSLQCKYSRDFLHDYGRENLRSSLKACGWFTLNPEKLRNSEADLWVLVLHPLIRADVQYVIIEPSELLRKLRDLRGDVKTFTSYVWVANDGRCWETRGLRGQDQDCIAAGEFHDLGRELTQCLNNWELLQRKLCLR